ncbi:type II toxin-antitoxin system Phd/YefM family antitoxin [Sphingomonas sp.]|uniref:type II toxin-antitoxin system Phd/YefM family antitoxin n=1 Tax=Sphingomonas sp. TaxID=28214 RepID=UPI001B12AD01|nr:type II toxin-antitoxin system Phd/YefM family antitoxin [Sphingomonas sp.]MBO9711426.1 type II toxin-antitoxin system Phd/YefM family antitoxin [Sphingomonas sp.]
MRYSTQIKPISDIKANAAGILDEIAETRNPVIITQNGRAKAVLMDVKSYEETQETLALLQLLALGQQDVAAGRTRPFREVLAEMKQKLNEAE